MFGATPSFFLGVSAFKWHFFAETFARSFFSASWTAKSVMISRMCIGFDAPSFLLAFLDVLAFKCVRGKKFFPCANDQRLIGTRAGKIGQIDSLPPPPSRRRSRPGWRARREAIATRPLRTAEATQPTT